MKEERKKQAHKRMKISLEQSTGESEARVAEKTKKKKKVKKSTEVIPNQ